MRFLTSNRPLPKPENTSDSNKNRNLMARTCAAAALFSSMFVSAVNVHALSCSVSGTSWNNGYVVNVTVNNDSDSAISAWEVNLDYLQSPGVSNSWNANISTSGDTVTASNFGWNGNLSSGQSATFGIMGKHVGSFVEPQCSIATTPTPPPSSISMSSSSISSSNASAIVAIGGTQSSSNNVNSGAGITFSPAPIQAPTPTLVPIPDPEIGEDETYFYLSYDDSASTAPRDLTFAALEYGSTPSASYGRAYEFLNAEKFDHFSSQQINPFTISMGLVQLPQSEIPINLAYEGDMYALGVNVSGPTLTKAERKNVVLTLLLDISGSMRSRYAVETGTYLITLLDVAKHGLISIVPSLKEGDILNLVTFDTSAEVVLTDWMFDADDTTYIDAVSRLTERGSTNLNRGITLAYEVANRSYDATKANRVIILTDAYANTGEIAPEVIADHTVINGMEGILFSGIGIGASFNEAFLNELTDIGKSTYSAMVTPTDAERIFSDGFMRFVDHAVENIQFRLDYPQSLDQLKSASEEISTDSSKVSTVNYAFNSSQFFFELFNSDVEVDTSETIKLTATFNDEMGEVETIVVEKSIADLMAENSDQIYAAAAVTTLANLVARDITCDAVFESGLYAQYISSEVFVTYLAAIKDYCTHEPVDSLSSTGSATSFSNSSYKSIAYPTSSTFSASSTGATIY